LPVRLQAATFVGPRRVSPILDEKIDATSVRSRLSRQLTLCSGTLPLVLEGAAANGETQPAFLVQVMNPCWIWPDADLSDTAAVKLTLAAAPFNFQLGADIDKVRHRPASSPGGEFQVWLDNCDSGELLATAPLVAGETQQELTVALPARQGVHALCIAYAAGPRVDPIWGLYEMELIARAGHG
jgi:hexosaminidase